MTFVPVWLKKEERLQNVLYQLGPGAAQTLPHVVQQAEQQRAQRHHPTLLLTPLCRGSQGESQRTVTVKKYSISDIRQRQRNYFCTYDLYGPVRNVYDAGRYIMWASGRGFGPENREFSGPCEMASNR
jgi:hypothetical protein